VADEERVRELLLYEDRVLLVDEYVDQEMVEMLGKV
jgi:hypothetical protein